MNRYLLVDEVQEYLEAHYKQDAGTVALKGSPFPLISSQELATQLAGKKKAAKKLPSWFHTRGVVYPPAVNLEQTSSEATARYKASLVGGSRLADLTGGFGVDSLYFSRQVDKVWHVEQDRFLSELAAHNLRIQGAIATEFICGDSLEFLRNTSESFDWIYLDPSRRSDTGGRVFRLEDGVPNVVEELEFLLSKSPNLLIKTAPLLDIQAGLRELSQVREIHIVAVNNEVKELLWVLGEATEPLVVKTVNITAPHLQRFEAPLEQPMEALVGPPATYLYEPNAAIMKSGLFGHVGAQYQLKKLHLHSHLFTSDQLMEFPGRRFLIKEKLTFNKKQIRKAFGGSKAHISTRNFPLNVASLRRELKIKDGGDTYLFFTTLSREERAVLVCQKV